MGTLTDVKHCTIADVGLEITGTDAPSLVAALNEYFGQFAKPIRRDGANMLFGSIKCMQCDEILDGACGRFTWGIVHGEGHCGKCGYPGRAYHRPKNDDDEIFDRVFEMILQYHPDNVSVSSHTPAR